MYYESGAVEWKGNCVDGQLQGERIWYYKSGEVEVKGNYEGGLLQGERIYYNVNGEIEKTKNDKHFSPGWTQRPEISVFCVFGSDF